MALFLTTAAIGLAVGNPPGVGETVLRFLWQFALGGAFGYLAGRAYPWIMSHADLEYEGLYPVLSLGLVLAIYALCALTGANSLLAAYTAGIVAAREDFFHRRSMARFHAGVAWLMQITMFTVLGLLVFPSRLPAVVGVGLGAAAGSLSRLKRPSGRSHSRRRGRATNASRPFSTACPKIKLRPLV